MWNLVCGSVVGTSHQRTGQPCQDFSASKLVATHCGPVLVAACSDGAGSAEMAEVGAALAVQTFIASAEEGLLNESLVPAAVDQGILHAWNMSWQHKMLGNENSRFVYFA
ncbi:MAG: protein phosphatase 2C domain-containing protein [Isosphaeraceae bacterium]